MPKITCVKSSGIIVTNQCPVEKKEIGIILTPPLTFFGGAFGKFLLPTTGSGFEIKQVLK